MIEPRLEFVKEQKVLVLDDEPASIIQNKVNDIINDGWFVVSVNSQHVSTGANTRNAFKGGYFVLFERHVLKK